MYARVARFEGGEAEALRKAAAEVAEMAPNGPPPGVPACGFTMLIDPDSGRSISISLFETEEALRTGDAALNDMSTSSDQVGERVSVETYEVGVDIRLQEARA